MTAFFSSARETAHSVLAVLSAVGLAASGSAVVLAGIIGEFGGRVSATDFSAKTAAVSAGALMVSKLIDSANNAAKTPLSAPQVTYSTGTAGPTSPPPAG